MKKLLLISLFVFISLPAFAQLEIGGSYELRDESPQSGFGVRIQSSILQQVPLIDLGIRLHASYFSESNSIEDGALSYSQDFENYDFGVAAYGGITIGLLEPYVGVGLGSETIDLKFDDIQGVPIPGEPLEDEEESNVYWNTFAGAKVTIIPLVKPFVEYRFTSRDLEVPNLDDKTGRIMFGVVLSL